MKNSKNQLFLLILLLIFLPFNLHSQSEHDLEKIKLIENSYQNDLPSWLLMERGIEAFQLGEFGLASRVFREIIARDGISPDAEVYLGFIFEQEGEYQLAEKQYVKALENKNQMYILEDETAVLYRLSDIYRRINRYSDYEKTLVKIIEQDADSNKNYQLQYSMVNSIKQQGPDKLFELYRYKNNKYNKARTELGIFYYRTGRYSEAELNLIFPVMSAASTGFDYIYEKTAEYTYIDLINHVENMIEYPVLYEYLQENRFFESLYYIAAALYTDGFEQQSNYIWRIVSKHDSPESSWKKRADRQLTSPFIEPIITHRS